MDGWVEGWMSKWMEVGMAAPGQVGRGMKPIRLD